MSHCLIRKSPDLCTQSLLQYLMVLKTFFYLGCVDFSPQVLGTLCILLYSYVQYIC